MDLRETPEVQFARLMEAMQTPFGIFFALAALVFFVTMAFTRSGRYGLVSMLMFFSPMMVSVAVMHRFVSAITPFQQFRTYGRPVCGTILLFLVIPALLTPRGWRHRVFQAPAMAYLLFELVYSALSVVGGSPLRGLFGGGVYLMLFSIFGIGLGHWLQNLEDVRSLLRAVAWAGALFAFCTCIQLLVNSAAVVGGKRLFALTGNPQGAGLMFASCFPAMVFLTVWKDETKHMRLFWAISAAFVVVLLIWTGSRTAAMSTIITLGILFKRHIGRMMGFGIVLAVLVLAGLQLIDSEEVAMMSERLVSTSDTRTVQWVGMIENFLSSPVFGVPAEESLGSENSYLLAAARMGIMGLIPLALMLIATGLSMLTLHRQRAALREQSLLVDLVIGGLAGQVAGAFFEGYLLGTLIPNVFIVYIYFGLLAYLADCADIAAAYETAPPVAAGEADGFLIPRPTHHDISPA